MKTVLCSLALAGVAFAAHKPKTKTVTTTGTVTGVVICAGAQSTRPHVCQVDGETDGRFVAFVHVPSLHATYEVTPQFALLGNGNHTAPVEGREYRVRLKKDELYWLLGAINLDDPAGPQIKPTWQQNYIDRAAVDAPNRAVGAR